MIEWKNGSPISYSSPFLGSAATAHLESGGFIRSQAGVPHPDIQIHFLPSQVIDHGRKPPYLEAFQVILTGSLTVINLKTIFFINFY